ncbi:TetR/AcrR family transcriptional regulator [Pantoea rodasii]|uniref:TetR/AcrR family transcriptional regulator n=2 Tax=Pantoea rodasii TaxID=1076549 RepID=A0A2M9W7A0_9GAMM|nr:crotonobetainyl-CoA--carnitine CoA-transferase [Pantoea rodasii]PJZ03416.1 TetR/AcrR family transcriptional regulator [Pantoea rodasii]
MKKSDSQPSALRGRPKTQDEASRRQSIISHAFQAFIELGFAQTSTAEIARRAKISKRTLYEAFSDKKALFAAVIKQHRHLLLDLPRPKDEQHPLDETLFEIFRLNISEDEFLERDAILRLMTRESILFPELSDYLYESRAVRSRELLMEWLQTTANEKHLPLDDVEMVAGLLMDVVFGALVPHRRVSQTEERQKITAHIKRRIQIILLGTGWLNEAASQQA